MPLDNALPSTLPARLPSTQPGSVPADALADHAGTVLLTDGSQLLLVAS